MTNLREHRWSDQYQFWLGLTSLIFVIFGGIWHISSRLTTMENHIATQNQRVEIGFKHVSKAIDKLNHDKEIFDNRVREVFKNCCSELRASNE